MTSVINSSATLLCSHGGTALAIGLSNRVLVQGSAVVTIGTNYVISGCSLADLGRPACIAGQWLAGATRVLSQGAPLAVAGGPSVCQPTGTPLLAVVTQTRVSAA